LRPLLSALTAPAGSAVGAILALATLAAASRYDQHATLAGYAVGVTVAAMSATALAGGSTLAYTTGGLATQVSVRSLRRTIVAPASLVIVAIAGLWISSFTDLLVLSVLAGGIGAVANNLSELEAAHLRQRERVPRLTAVDFLYRIAQLLPVLAGADFAFTFAIASVVRLLVLSLVTRDDPSRKTNKGAQTFRQVYQDAFQLALFVTTVSYVLLDRLILLFVPLGLDAKEAGLIAVGLGAQQGLSAVSVSGLQVALAMRSQRPSTTWVRYLEQLMLAGAVCVALLQIAFAERLTRLLGIEEMGTAPWVCLALGLPLAVVARTVAFRLLASHRRRATAWALLLAGISAVAAGALVTLLSPSLTAYAGIYPASEAVAFLALCAASMNRRATPDKSPRTA
jgi:hypothetical protein